MRILMNSKFAGVAGAWRLCVAQLLVTEALMVLPVLSGHRFMGPDFAVILAPVSIVTLLPVGMLVNGEYIGLLVFLLVDAALVSFMILLILKNRKITNCIYLFVFNYVSMGLILPEGLGSVSYDWSPYIWWQWPLHVWESFWYLAGF